MFCKRFPEHLLPFYNKTHHFQWPNKHPQSNSELIKRKHPPAGGCKTAPTLWIVTAHPLRPPDRVTSGQLHRPTHLSGSQGLRDDTLDKTPLSHRRTHRPVECQSEHKVVCDQGEASAAVSGDIFVRGLLFVCLFVFFCAVLERRIIWTVASRVVWVWVRCRVCRSFRWRMGVGARGSVIWGFVCRCVWRICFRGMRWIVAGWRKLHRWHIPLKVITGFVV